jgi:membrane protein implicated in regulation of membrane protease activity
MEPWVIWLILAVVLAVAEIFTLTAALGLLGTAALITSLSAAVGLPLPVQLLVFILGSAAGLVLVRPIARRHMLRPQRERFGVEALVGRSAQVIHEVTDHGGRVRIDGEEWSARAYDATLVIPAGATVDVMAIRGATALVYPRE